MGDPRIHELLAKVGEMHDRKQEDYGSEADPFANVRASEEFGVPAWVGALVRLNDKVTRLKAFARKGTLRNESAKDSMLDIAVYALIAYILYEEEEPEGSVWHLSPHETITTPFEQWGKYLEARFQGGRTDSPTGSAEPATQGPQR